MKTSARSRGLLFIDGGGKSTSWRDLRRLMPPKIRQSIVNLPLHLLERKERVRKFDELVVFVNGHGYFCDLENRLDLRAIQIAEICERQFIARSYYFHFGSCSFFRKNCFRLDRVLRLSRNIKAISGFEKDIESHAALEIERALLMRLAEASNLDFNCLLQAKQHVYRSLPLKVQTLGFRMLLN